MGSFRVRLTPIAEKQFLAIPFPARRQLNQRILRLARQPRAGASEMPIVDAYQVKLHGWRIVFDVDDVSETVVGLAFLKD